MGKNMSATMCSECGEGLCYYGSTVCLDCKADWGEQQLEIDGYVIIEDWQEKIKKIWTSILKNGLKPNFANPDTYFENGFLSEIWKMSQKAFDVPREVQVVIDSNDILHISFGTPGYVDFKIDPVGMKLPIKCWIHTHPMGNAYFSGTDWKTLKTWKPMMETAIVLGDNQYWAYHLDSEIVKTVKFAKLSPPVPEKKVKYPQHPKGMPYKPHDWQRHDWQRDSPPFKRGVDENE